MTEKGNMGSLEAQNLYCNNLIPILKRVMYHVLVQEKR